MGWITIGVALTGILWSVVWYLVQRRVSRIDLLEQAVFGDSGVRSSMQKFITHEVLRARLQEFHEQLKGVSEEGQRREDRILEAIKAQTEMMGVQMREIRDDMRNQSTRIDAMFHPAINGR